MRATAPYGFRYQYLAGGHGTAGYLEFGLGPSSSIWSPRTTA